MCELEQKHYLHKPPGLVKLSQQQKEGKNEKGLYIHNNFDGTDSLHNDTNPGT
jgi:hypothetical protein